VELFVVFNLFFLLILLCINVFFAAFLFYFFVATGSFLFLVLFAVSLVGIVLSILSLTYLFRG